MSGEDVSNPNQTDVVGEAATMTELTDEFGDPIYVVLINTQTIVQNNQKDIANDLEQEIAKAMLNYFLEAMIGDNQLMLLVQMMRTHPNGIEELLDRENVTTYAHANVRNTGILAGSPLQRAELEQMGFPHFVRSEMPCTRKPRYEFYLMEGEDVAVLDDNAKLQIERGNLTHYKKTNKEMYDGSPIRLYRDAYRHAKIKRKVTEERDDFSPRYVVDLGKGGEPVEMVIQDLFPLSDTALRWEKEFTVIKESIRLSRKMFSPSEEDVKALKLEIIKAEQLSMNMQSPVMEHAETYLKMGEEQRTLRRMHDLHLKEEAGELSTCGALCYNLKMACRPEEIRDEDFYTDWALQREKQRNEAKAAREEAERKGREAEERIREAEERERDLQRRRDEAEAEADQLRRDNIEGEAAEKSQLKRDKLRREAAATAAARKNAEEERDLQRLEADREGQIEKEAREGKEVAERAKERHLEAVQRAIQLPNCGCSAFFLRNVQGCCVKTSTALLSILACPIAVGIAAVCGVPAAIGMACRATCYKGGDFVFGEGYWHRQCSMKDGIIKDLDVKIIELEDENKILRRQTGRAPRDAKGGEKTSVLH